MSKLKDPFQNYSFIVEQNFGKADGTIYKLNWVPLIYYIAFQGTIFNWEDIISNNLSSSIAVAQGGLTQKKAGFSMYSYLIDCILDKHPFPKLGCIWNRAEYPIDMSYHIIWPHPYASYYNLICEYFLVPLYWIIFPEEPNCFFENAMVVISEYGDYYFSQEGTYIRIYGCSRARSLLLRYAIEFVVHKEAVR